MRSPTWHVIPGFPDYRINSVGTIKSLDRYRNIKFKHAGSRPRLYPGKIIKPKLHRNGYLYVSLENYGSCLRPVHHWVALTFLGPKLAKHQVNHIDGNKLNNAPSNLEYITAKDNVRHSIALNKRCTQKLDISTVREVKKLLASGSSVKDTAKKLSIPINLVHNIKAKRTWSYV